MDSQDSDVFLFVYFCVCVCVHTVKIQTRSSAIEVMGGEVKVHSMNSQDSDVSPNGSTLIQFPIEFHPLKRHQESHNLMYVPAQAHCKF